MRYSTGRNSRLKHVTGLELEEKMGEQRRGTVRYSTGEESRVRHSTGTDLKREMVHRCPVCHGSGEWAEGKRCPECGGRGVVSSLSERHEKK
ncbi:MAG: hypothetical protein ACE5IH_08825 [Thermodesulfobacteriota bacterium]